MTAQAAIITAIYGDYDELRPVLTQAGIDVEWICVTDRPRQAHGWRIVVQPKPTLHRNVAAKEPKCAPWRYTTAGMSIWIDGSFRVTSDRFAVEALMVANPIAQYAHPQRECIYDEVEHCREHPKYAALALRSQADAYRAQGHPERWGLWAGGVIARRHTPEVRSFGESWLNEIDQWGFQDQISGPFCLRRAGLSPSPLPGSIFDGRWLSYEGSNRHAASVPQ